MASNFAEVFKSIQKKITLSRNQALNKALTKTKTLYAKNVSSETGLSSARVKQRAKIFKANISDERGTLSIGTRVIFAASDFKPLSKRIKSRVGIRYGATIKIGKNGRELVPGGFIVQGKNSGKTIVIQRVGDARYPTKTALVNIFIKTVEDQAPSLRVFLSDEFRRILTTQLEYNLGK